QPSAWGPSAVAMYLIASTSVVPPSPLNGERAGVRGENAHIFTKSEMRSGTDRFHSQEIPSRSRQRVESRRQCKVFIRQPALVVRGERQCHIVPADVDVGVVPGLFRGAGDGVDELHRDDKIFELVGAADDAARPAPAGNAFEGL